jgi:Fic family protein
LQAVRDRGDWEGWLKFFLQGIAQVAEEATVNARRIVKMREEHRDLILTRLGRASGKALQLLERLYFRPIVSVPTIMEITGLSFANANSLTRQLRSIGLLQETTGRKRNRRFSYSRYLDLFDETRDVDEAGKVE